MAIHVGCVAWYITINFTEKTERILQLIRSEKERYSVKLVEKAKKVTGKDGREFETEPIWDARPDPKGNYVRRSKVLHDSHLPVSGWNGFDALVDTLVGAEKVTVVDAQIKQTAKTKEGKETSGYRSMRLIGLHSSVN